MSLICLEVPGLVARDPPCYQSFVAASIIVTTPGRETEIGNLRVYHSVCAAKTC